MSRRARLAGLAALSCSLAMLAASATAQSADQRGWTVVDVAPGDWTYKQAGPSTQALFSQPDAGADLSISCDLASGRIEIAVRGATKAPAVMTIRTSFGDVSLPAIVEDSGASTPRTIIRRPSSEQLFDWIAYSRGRISVELGGVSRLIVPTWAQIDRVVEDCRG